VSYPELRSETDPDWVRRIEERPLDLLSDHAHNELKAASTAQAWLLKKPQDETLVLELAKLAAEEMEHFDRVVRLLYGRGGTLQPVENNLYADRLLKGSAKNRKDVYLDRMIVAALIEARSCERFELLAEHLEDAELAQLYRDLIPCEVGHNELFIDLTRRAFPESADGRIEELFELEAEVLAELPFAYRMHSGCI
jgi:tRNA 2-(methylsulfanyl)-N6-isopentenyladenosine37 hydroxylase